MTAAPSGSSALAGLTVLEVSNGVAASYCGRLLAMYGARVILVEPPAGSQLRRVGPFASDQAPAETGALFQTLAAGKEGIVVEFGRPAGAAALRALYEQADVLITDEEAFLDSLGHDYRSLQTTYPRLVYTAISPLGASGPYASYGADPGTVYALGGYTFVTGEAGREPLKGPENIPAYTAGANAYSGTLAAIWARRRTGEGQRVEVTEMESLVAGHQFTVSRYSYERFILQRTGNRYAGTFALVNFYDCSDGVVAMSAAATPMMQTFLQMIAGHPELADHVNPDPTGDFDDFDAALRPWFAEHTRAEVVEMCQTLRVPAASALEVDELLTHQQLVSRGWWHQSVDPLTPGVLFPGQPYRMPGSPFESARPPRLGEESAAVAL